MPRRPTPARATGRGHAPGTCGELAQGRLPGGQRFHVTCPIDRGASVSVELVAAPGGATQVIGLPHGRDKIEQALVAAADLLGLGPARIRVTAHTTQLQTGKGMASSTADIVAAARALAAAAGTTLPSSELARLAARIESSDGIAYDGICAADHRSGELLRRWSWWPTFAIAMAVPPASLDTAAADFAGQEDLADDYAALLAGFDAAARAQDPAAFARGSTGSALLNERFVRNPVLPVLRPLAEPLGALGLVVGHTGTLAGLLFDGAAEDGEAAAAAAAAELAAALPEDVAVFVAHTPAPAAVGAGS